MCGFGAWLFILLLGFLLGWFIVYDLRGSVCYMCFWGLGLLDCAFTLFGVDLGFGFRVDFLVFDVGCFVFLRFWGMIGYAVQLLLCFRC